MRSRRQFHHRQEAGRKGRAVPIATYRRLEKPPRGTFCIWFLRRFPEQSTTDELLNCRGEPLSGVAVLCFRCCTLPEFLFSGKGKIKVKIFVQINRERLFSNLAQAPHSIERTILTKNVMKHNITNEDNAHLYNVNTFQRGPLSNSTTLRTNRNCEAFR